MADSLRRSTLHDANARSGIPLPSTVKKPAAAGRMSLAGPALRNPVAPGSAGPSSNPRQSVYRSQNVNPLMQSASKPNFGRTPLNNSTRRGSIWPGAQAPAAINALAKDPRPLRDRSFQTKMRQDIVSCLQQQGAEIPLSTLSNIQGKDYRMIFEYLLNTLDPNYPLSSHLKLEEVFVPALKAIRYPYAHQIDNKWLAAPASPHSWPYLLGVLHWLAEQCQDQHEYLESGHPSLQKVEDVPEEFDDMLHHGALAFDYYQQAYTIWLNLQDDFSEPQNALDDRYAKKNERINRDLDQVTRQLDEAQIEYNKLKSSAAPMAKLEKENGLLVVDCEKFERILAQYQGRQKKLADAIALEQSELATGKTYLEQLQAEQQQLSETVKSQNLTPEEVLQMTTEHEQLSRNIEDLKLKISETYRTANSLEVNVTNRAAATEEALEAYTNLLSLLDLLPPLPAPLQNIDLTLELNTAASNPTQLLVGADIRKVIKPTLNSVAESKRSERASVESERIKVDNELDLLTQECENIDDELAELERKIGTLNEQADDLRDAAQRDALVANGEAARLERDLAHARTAALANGMGVKSQLQGMQFSYREQLEKVSRLKDETVRAIVKHSHDIAMFKEEVSSHLRELREFAELG
ncbi:HEC/Ndc80p family-domain-containing protein [Mycena floridula]|nr:HEC/Ndc80p family-domain-containing protein [Mycena floridula]